jgi:peptide/nickel transport system substrate-binding protein
MAGWYRKALGAGIAVSLILVGSTTAGAGRATTAGAKIDPNGVLKYARDIPNTFGDNFDPGAETNDCSYSVTSLILESVTKDGSNTKISGGIAQSWDVSPDALTVTLHLRTGNVFSDGTPVTADALKASIEHIKKSPLRTSLFLIDTMDVTDPNTLVLHLTKPVAGDLLWALTYIDGQIVSPSSFNAAADHPIGSGPYTLDKYTPGELISLKKNPKYHDANKYKLGGVDFVQVGIGPQTLTALKSGAVDMIDMRPEDFPAAKNDPSLGIATTPSFDYSLIQLRQDTPPFDNEQVRVALEYGVDRNEIDRVVYNGQNEVAVQPFPKFSPAHNKSLDGKYGYNPQKAKKMLQKAGVSLPVKFDMAIPAGATTFERMAPLLKNELKRAGFDVHIVPIQPADILNEVYLQKNTNAFLSVSLTNGPASWNNFQSNYTSTGFVAGAFGSKRPEIEDLVAKARTSIDNPSVSSGPMQQAAGIIMQKGYEVPLVFERAMVAYRKDRVGGNVHAPIGACRSDLEGVFIKK